MSSKPTAEYYKAPDVSKMNSHLSNESQSSILGSFTSFYDKKANRKSDETEKNAPVVEHVQSFYELVTDFYEYGYGESFHFCPVYDNLSMTANIQQYEIEISKSLGARPGMTILDIGCGIGGPARNIGRYSGAHIVGVNISDYQIQRAKILTEAAKLQDTVTYQKADFCNMENVEDNSVDGVYALESTCHSSDPLIVYKELFRVMKPGALCIDSAWVMTDKYQPGNPEHEKIKHDIELGNGLPELRTNETVFAKMKEAGLEIIEVKYCEDEGDLPWDIYLLGKGCFSLQAFRTSWLGRCCTHYALSALETIKMVPSGTTKVHSVLLTAADGLVASRKVGIFSPMCRILAKKPAN